MVTCTFPEVTPTQLLTSHWSELVTWSPALSQKSHPHSSLHLIGQNCVTWPHKLSQQPPPYLYSHPIGQNCVTWPPQFQERFWSTSVFVGHISPLPNTEFFFKKLIN